MSKSVKSSVIPWSDVLSINAWYTSYIEYEDTKKTNIKRYIFLPNDIQGPGLGSAIINAYNLAITQNKFENWKGFNIIIKIGEDAGQEFDKPYIEVIPIKNKTNITESTT